jgi:hypothetical protein
MRLLLEAVRQHLHQNEAYIKELTNQINNLDDDMERDNIESPHAPPYGQNDFGLPQNTDIELGSKDVMTILGISSSTLTRWRSDKKVKFRYLSSNHVVYLFSDLYDAVKSGKATCKGFSNIDALKRMDDYLSKVCSVRNISVPSYLIKP